MYSSLANSEVSTVASQDEPTQEDHLMNEKINPKIVEKWISVTLDDAKYLDLPGWNLHFTLLQLESSLINLNLGVITNPSHKEPLERHGIDRVA